MAAEVGASSYRVRIPLVLDNMQQSHHVSTLVIFYFVRALTSTLCSRCRFGVRVFDLMPEYCTT
jgi:hypothetical protein